MNLFMEFLDNFNTFVQYKLTTMAIIQFFRLNKAREFNYTPLFYNKEKEEFKERIRRIEEEMGIKNAAGYNSGIRRGTMREHIQDSRRQKRYSSTRLVAIIIFLLALAYLILFR